MTHPAQNVEDRLTAALHARAADVRPADDSLDTIRRRAGAARRRRRATVTGVAAAALVAAALAVPTLRDPPADSVRTDDELPSPTTPTTAEPPPGTTVPGGPTANVDGALWPDPSATPFTDPVEAARSFVETVVRVDDPPLSEFRSAEPGAGEVDVYGRGEDGRRLDRVAATIVLRQLDGEHWFVTAAGTDDVQIDTPEPLAAVASPIAVAGRGRGYEGTIAVELRARSVGAELIGREVTIAGSGEALEPFTVEVRFSTGPGVGVLLARDDPGAEPGVPSFAALPVRLGTGPAPSGEAPPGSGEPSLRLGGQPLWPFGTLAEADEWLAASAEGHSPWHADAEATAVAFTTGYLGFTEIDEVTSHVVEADEAWIGVGYEPQPGMLATAAVVHLVRFGPTPDAPWEVVGTRDSRLTLDTPAYGSTVSSPVTVGGAISGVDESLRVQVHQLSSPEPIGEACCLAAGGERTPWSTSVSFARATEPVLTIVVSTGGQVQGVEAFAVTAVAP